MRRELLLWDVAERRQVSTLGRAGSAAFSRDSSLLAVCRPGARDAGAVITLWDVRAGKEVRSFPEAKAGYCKRLSFTEDGKTLFVVGKRVVGLDAVSGRELFSWRMQPPERRSGMREFAGGVEVKDDDPWRAAAVSPDGSVFAGVLSAGPGRERVDDRIVLCDGRTGKVLLRCNDSGLPSSGWEQLEFSPDGRLLVSSDGEVVHLWEVVTGKEVHTFQGHRGEVRSLAFSANGRRLASSSSDSTAVLWDLTGKAGEKEVAGWWADLAGEDALRAWAAVWRLADAPAASVPFLRRQLRPVTDAEVKQIRQHIADLDSETFAVREKAHKELQRLGMAAWPALREALEKEPSAEFRRRAEKLLDPAIEFSSSPEELRQVRALQVLEQIRSPESRRLLEKLAAGAPEARLTRDAKAALERLEGRRIP